MDDTADPNYNLNNSLPPVGDNAQPQVQPAPPVSVPHGAKEAEPGSTQAKDFAEEAKLVAQIESTAEEVDKKALEVIEKELSDVRAGAPQPQLPPDVADAGVTSPQAEADKVIQEGPSFNVPLTEDAYQAGLKTAVKGKYYYQEKEVVGVSSLAALALWVKRLISKAHKHTMRVVFGKKQEPVEPKKEVWR